MKGFLASRFVALAMAFILFHSAFAVDYWSRAQVPAGTKEAFNGNSGSVLTMLKFLEYGYEKKVDLDLCPSEVSRRPVLRRTAEDSNSDSTVFIGCERDIIKVTVDNSGEDASKSLFYTAEADIVGEMMMDVEAKYLLLTTASGVVLIDADNGDELWSQTVSVTGSAVIGRSSVYVQTSNDQVCSFDKLTGSVNPCVTIPENIVSPSPLVDDSGNLFVCGSTKLYLVSGSIVSAEVAVNGCRDMILSSTDEVTIIDSGNSLVRVDSSSSPMTIVQQTYVSSGRVNSLARADIIDGSSRIKKLYLSQENGVTVVDNDEFNTVIHQRSSTPVMDAVAVTSATDFIFASEKRLIGVPANEDGNPIVYFQEAASGELPVHDYESRPLLLNPRIVFTLSKDSGHGLVYSQCKILRSDETPEPGVDYCPNIVYDPSESDNFGLIIAGAAAVLLIPAGMYGCKKTGIIKCKSL